MVTELLKQPQYSTMKVSEMALTLFAVNRGYLDDVEVKKALSFESALQDYMRHHHAALMDRIESSKDVDAEAETAPSAAIEEFKRNAVY